MSNKDWVLGLPIGIMEQVMENCQFSELAKPVVLVFATDDHEYSAQGFQTRAEAKEYMEQRHDESEGWYLNCAFFEGREVEYKARCIFDFVEKKGR